jgi:hypothetical protein
MRFVDTRIRVKLDVLSADFEFGVVSQLPAMSEIMAIDVR